jgi:hypothetical protein
MSKVPVSPDNDNFRTERGIAQLEGEESLTPRLSREQVLALTAEQRNDYISQGLALLHKGRTLDQIEAMLGLDSKTIRLWMYSAVPEKYRAAKDAAIDARIVQADDKLENAVDHVEITKRAHQARFARHDAERQAPKRWGAKQELTIVDDRPPMDMTTLARTILFVQEQARLQAAPDKPAPTVIDAEVITPTPTPEPASAAST